MTNQPRAWAAIDLLRFASALLVVGYHFGAALPLRPSAAAAGALGRTVLTPRFASWTSFGWIGVEIFFVISGYVIACSAEGATPHAFLRRRAQRLLPAAWVCATLTFAALVAVGALPIAALLGQWVRSVGFWPLGDPIDPSYWTLGIEASFYLIVAARLRGGASRARIERLGWWIGGSSAVFWAALLLGGGATGSLGNERLAQLLLLSHGVFFAIGVLLQAVHRDGATRARLAGLALFLGAAMLEIIGHAADRGRDLGVSADPIAPTLAFVGGVAVVALCRRIQPRIGWTCGWAATLGLMTYPLYLLHQQIGAVAAGLWPSLGLPVSLFISVALAWLVVRYAEPPLRRMIGALSARRGPVPDIPPSAFPRAG